MKFASLLGLLLPAQLCGLLMAVPAYVAAEAGLLTNSYGENIKCAPIMGSKKNKESMIEVKFPPRQISAVSVQIFEWEDRAHIGRFIARQELPEKYRNILGDSIPINPMSQFNELVGFLYCGDQAISLGLCSERERGEAIIDGQTGSGPKSKTEAAIFNDYVHLGDSQPGYTNREYWQWTDSNEGLDKNTADQKWKEFVVGPRNFSEYGSEVEWEHDGALDIKYHVNDTGYYCVRAWSENGFAARVNWVSSSGKLPLVDYPKVPFYGFMTLVYMAIAVVWAYKSWRVWKDILPVQNQLFGLICLMIVDMGVSYGFWNNYNKTGYSSMGWLAAMVVLDAGRNSLSFFMLLVVSLGWGVLRRSLGRIMKWCIGMGLFHFLSGCLFGSGVVISPPKDGQPVSLIYILPLSLATLIFYLWTLWSIFRTVGSLQADLQSYKLQMYTRLGNLLVISLVLLVGFLFANVISMGLSLDSTWMDRNWRWQWLLMDGWLNLEYLLVFGSILLLWRPNSENRRYSLEQVAEDEYDAIERERQRAANGDAGLEYGNDVIPLGDLGGGKPHDGRATASGHHPLPEEVFVLEDEDDNDEEEEDLGGDKSSSSSSNGRKSPGRQPHNDASLANRAGTSSP